MLKLPQMSELARSTRGHLPLMLKWECSLAYQFLQVTIGLSKIP